MFQQLQQEIARNSTSLFDPLTKQFWILGFVSEMLLHFVSSILPLEFSSGKKKGTYTLEASVSGASKVVSRRIRVKVFRLKSVSKWFCSR